MATSIHPTAIVARGASLGENVTIGPYCCIGDHVRLEDSVTLHAHVMIDGRTTIREGTTIFPFACLGYPPQSLKYKDEPSTLQIGRFNIIREYVTINPGTSFGAMRTVVGDYCHLMVGAHVAHDCCLGNYVTMANNATLGGHVIVGDYANIGGLAAIHQFVRIGQRAIISGMAGVKHDVIPYGAVLSNVGFLAGLNVVGLKRAGMPREHIESGLKAYEILFESKEGTLFDRVERVRAMYPDQPIVSEIIDFIAQDSTRALCAPR